MSKHLEVLFTEGLPKPFGAIWIAIRYKDINGLGKLFEELPKFGQKG